MTTRPTLGCLALLLLVATTACAQADDAQKAAIEAALQSGGTWAATIFLDEKGMARGDYDLQSGVWNEYEPAWHTGQTINGLLAAYEIIGDESLLAAARRAGNWWVSLEITDHPTLTGYVAAVHGDNVGDRINFTTIADGTPGLFRLWRHTNDERYAAVPTQAGQWAIDNLYLPEAGLIYDLVDVETGEIWTDKSSFFAGELTVHHVARPNNEGYLYYDMYQYTNEERYREMFIALCESLVEKQSANGLWMDYHPNRPKGEGPNEHPKGYAHPRFNIWYAESLMKGYDLTGDRRYLEAAVRTAREVQRWQRGDGRIYYRNYIDGSYNASSITGSAVSFAGILWLMLQQEGYTEFDDNIERSVDWVLKNQFAADHADPNLRSAFFEIRTRSRDGIIWPRMRGIATAFGLRFLSDYYKIHYGAP